VTLGVPILSRYAVLCLLCGPHSVRIYAHVIFECSGASRDLHSFPTRRSSDLAWVLGKLADRLGGKRQQEVLSQALDAALAIEDRSEEHTSELQSRENLVCRLLLEKKKRNAQDSSSIRWDDSVYGRSGSASFCV